MTVAPPHECSLLEGHLGSCVHRQGGGTVAPSKRCGKCIECGEPMGHQHGCSHRLTVEEGERVDTVTTRATKLVDQILEVDEDLANRHSKQVGLAALFLLREVELFLSVRDARAAMLPRHGPCIDGHDYEPVGSSYFKQDGTTTGLGVPSYDQSVSYQCLFCRRCAETVEIIRGDHRKQEADDAV